MGTVHSVLLKMKVILAFALFIAVASAVSVPTCEQKNVVLKDALLKLAKEKMAKADCGTCYSDILTAASLEPGCNVLKTFWELGAPALPAFANLSLMSVEFLVAAGAVKEL